MMTTPPRPQSGLFLCTTFLVLLLPASALAGPPSKRLFEALEKEAKTLLTEDLHVDVETGLWWANLDRGLTALVDLDEDFRGYDNDANKARRSIGTGSGLVRSVGISVQLKDNYAALDYFSNKLLNFAQDKAKDRIDNPIAQDLVEQFLGEFRPDLSDLADIDAEVWVRAEYGRLEGKIENIRSFRSRNGRAYFPRKGEGWETEYYGAELGVFPFAGGDEGGSWRAGLYLRYRNFDRPLVLGSSSESTAQLHLNDTNVGVYELGMRSESLHCDDFCFLIDWSMVPATGYTRMDFGPVGQTGSLSFSLSGNLEVSYPVSLGDRMLITPYAGFRAEYLLVSSPNQSTALGEAFSFSLSEDEEIDTSFDAQVGTPDYLFWGPTLGLNISL